LNNNLIPIYIEVCIRNIQKELNHMNRES